MLCYRRDGQKLWKKQKKTGFLQWNFNTMFIPVNGSFAVIQLSLKKEKKVKKSAVEKLEQEIGKLNIN